MNIGFDVSQTGSAKAGCGFYADNLIKNLATVDKTNRYLLYPTFGNAYWDNHYSQTVRIKQKNFQRGLRHRTHRQAKHFWEHLNDSNKRQLGEVDIIHTNNFFCPPPLRSVKMVYTLYDLSFLQYPQYSTEANRLVCFEGVFKASVFADHIIAISENTKNHFLNMFPHFNANHISVAYPASRFATSKQIIAQPKRLTNLVSKHFWLNLGTIEPRKNQLGLLHAYAKLRKKMPDTVPLVLAGGRGWLMDSFEQAIADLELQHHVVRLGYVTETELLWLYQHCFCLVYPSFFEGFGLPVLEAMTVGAPVITSNSSSIPEITGPETMLIDPGNSDSITDAMFTLAQNSVLYHKLKQLSLRQANKFSWRTSAEWVLHVYNTLV